MSGTVSRHRALRSVITEQVVSSQVELVGLLAGRGFEVTQATISRDLHAVGAVKARDATGALRYIVANGATPADEAHTTLSRLLAEYSESIEVSGNLVVVKTPPGAAHVVAAAIDAVGLPGTIGTVAGDDTMLIVADEATSGKAVAHALGRMGDGE